MLRAWLLQSINYRLYAPTKNYNDIVFIIDLHYRVFDFDLINIFSQYCKTENLFRNYHLIDNL